MKSQAANPAFDVTPARYVTAIITENGVAAPPFEDSIPRQIHHQGARPWLNIAHVLL